MANDAILTVLGTRIRFLRKALNMSQERLAELSELHPTYISDIERGKVNASVTTYHMIATALGLSASELLNVLDSSSEQVFANEVSALLNRLRKLDPKKQAAFLETASNIISSIEKL